MSDVTTSGAAPGQGGAIEGPGACIGPFTVLRKLGEGGFGAVFEAEQEAPVKRRVALKVIKLGMDTHEVIARFESERQALALMDHPHIARVLDAGATATGRPYFVMELVEGEPITVFCDARQLPIAARLALFDQVCTAVQHAHTKGIIHRDLKPSNVLVSEVDGRPFAKVIDFGIAKATSGRLTDLTLMTELHQIMGTPLYMSPEQASGSADIDTRTDLYSLGVVLYELLTGTTPVQMDGLRGAVFSEIQRVIRDVEPPRPSARVSQSAAAEPAVATRRSSEARKLARTVQGELDWIVMKALEKDRSRRYETANALALDVRRYLAGDPVLAAPPSASYRMQKFVRRHTGAVAAGSLVAASLLAGIAAFAWQARIAKARADDLEQVARFQAAMLGQVNAASAGRLLSDDVRAKFAAALVKAQVPDAERTSQAAAFGREWQRVNATDAARDLIDSTILKPAIAAIDQQFKDQPAVDATLRETLAGLYMSMGLHPAARPLVETALAIRRRRLGDNDPATLRSVDQMGEVLMGQGQLTEAERYFHDAMDGRRRALGNAHPETLISIGNMGSIMRAQGKFKEAESYQREALEQRRRVLGEDHLDTLRSLNNLGLLLKEAGNLADGERYSREAAEKSRRVLGPDHPSTLDAINNLGLVLIDQGKGAEAEPLLRESLAAARRVLGEGHPETITYLNNLASLLDEQRRQAEAEPLYREAIEKGRRFLGDEHPTTLFAISNLGVLLATQGKVSAAEPYFREVLQARRHVLGDEHPDTLDSMMNLAVMLSKQDKLAEAEALLRETVEKNRRVRGPEHPNTLASVKSLGSALVAAGKYADAEALLAPLGATFRKTFAGDSASWVAVYLVALGKARKGLGEFAGAEAVLLEAYPLFVKIRGPKYKDTRDCVQTLIDVYTAWHAAKPGQGHDAKAAAWRRKLAETGS